MENPINSQGIHPPKLIPTFVAGFNAIANHVYLILFPVMLDALFWFGPLVRVKELIQPVFERSLQEMASVYPPETFELLQTSKDIILQFFNQLNLLFALRSYPVGIPSLMVGIAPMQNPLGDLAVLEMNDFSTALLLIIGCLVLGVIGGGLYFGFIARITNTKKSKADFSQIMNQMKNVFVYFILVIFMAIGILLPSLCLISSITIFLPSLGSIPYFVLGVILIWILLPFAFSAHGIFAGHLSAINSISTSVRLVRKYLPGTGLFLLVAILLSQGLDMLWSTPDSNNWLTLVGIVGHAFISSGVLAASFIYYSNGMEFMHEMMRRETAKQEMPQATLN